MKPRENYTLCSELNFENLSTFVNWFCSNIRNKVNQQTLILLKLSSAPIRHWEITKRNNCECHPYNKNDPANYRLPHFSEFQMLILSLSLSFVQPTTWWNFHATYQRSELRPPSRIRFEVLRGTVLSQYITANRNTVTGCDYWFLVPGWCRTQASVCVIAKLHVRRQRFNSRPT